MMRIECWMFMVIWLLRKGGVWRKLIVVDCGYGIVSDGVEWRKLYLGDYCVVGYVVW